MFAEGNVAVVTGAASGIGRAAAERFAALGMRLVLFDQDEDTLARVASGLRADVRHLAGNVARFEDLERLRDLAIGTFGKVSVLMNNAAIGGREDGNWTGLSDWRRIIEVNLWGVVNGVHAFTEAMLAQHSRGAIINTGSKQGITNPPGFPAYNVAKSGVKTLTEQLAHGLRGKGDAVTAHLLVPGWTYTGMTHAPDGKQPAGTWTAGQVIELMMPRVEVGDFYVICPDGAVTPELDAARILWSATDMTENRPALSRWHPDWETRFDDFVSKETGA
ncbi:SDR family oxidoreductase [Bradyrhizobium sp. PRIMUS42]|uniref:SDR family NAD(P)-dependent oxidoreductase n=1 Tax=Bradyrhizobium sp. PRIMUS42 TaxID=2908926 RepID=UPI001FF377ED|nr:SDR family NAD(P)-dependent oxidoreductase [Bradyrhizobium sp. PRIMUS42]MCJ9730037.1 SDR family NAD(P)-dependent oxidoreductase [Bradyrhizobium sp. PRIMUS42]